MGYLDNQIVELRRQVERLRAETPLIYFTEPKNPTTSSILIIDNQTKYWDGKNWIISGGTLLDWSTSVLFTASDYRTINWSAGVVSIGTSTTKTDYATTSGNFTMSATTYFYWQEDLPTAIQTTTTPGNAVTGGGIILAVCQLNPDITNSASIKTFGGGSTDLIISSNIVANSITSNMLQANSITASKLATTLLYAGAITLDTNGTIKGGQTAYDTGNGFFLGYSGSAYKLSIGNSSGNKMTYDSTNLNITGGVIDGTSTIGGRVASTLATAIDSSGHFADSAISTATNTILGAFTFGVSGALQIGTYVNGVSGDIRISPTGILGRDKDNNTTFSINATTGVAVLNGLVVGTNVGLGTAQDSAGVTTIVGNVVTTGFVNALNVTAASMNVGGLTAGTISSKSIVMGITAGTGDVEIRAVIDTGDFANAGAKSGFILGLDDSDSDKAKFYFGDPTNYIKWDGSALTVTGVITTSAGSSIGSSYLSGAIPQTLLNIANRGWGQTCVFSVTDADTVAWTSGVFTSADGTTYNIDAGNTGNMSAKTYIYLDLAVSTTVYQITTTSATAVGLGKVMVCIAQNGTVEASFMVMQGQGAYNIDASNIVAGSITTNEIAATTITAANIATLNMTGKSCTFDTGTVGGWTLGATTLSATSGGNTTILSSGSTAFSAGPTGSPTITISQAGVLTATGAIINGYTLSTKGTFGGDGTDGIQTDADLTITGSNNTIITKNFSSWTAGSVARTCTITPTGCITYLKIKGDADFTNWTFDFAGKGMPGGTGGSANNDAPGSDGVGSTSSTIYLLNTSPIYGIGGTYSTGPKGGGGGGGGAGLKGVGFNGTTGTGSGLGGTGGEKGSIPFYLASLTGYQFNKMILTVAQGGAGGGGGSNYGATTEGNGGNGGNGGGTLIIEVGGNITFSGTTINCSGENGDNGTTGAGNVGGGGGGGGGGGLFVLTYNGTKTGTVTPTVAKGVGGAGGVGSQATGGDGGNGNDGLYLIEQNISQ